MNMYFLASFVLLLAFYVIRFPILSYQSELWAEQGTNYLYNAMENDIWDNLTATDAGYLVIYPRILAMLTYYVFPLKFFPYVTNMAALINIGFFVSYFCSKDYRRIISSDAARMAICLFLGLLILPHFENFSYVNWSYHGILFCLLLLWGDIDSWSKKRYFFLMGIAAVLSASKFHFVLFFPLYALFIAYHLKNKNYRKGCFFLPAFLMIVLQICSVLTLVGKDGFITNNTAAQMPLTDIVMRMVNGMVWVVQFFAPGRPLLLSVLIFGIVIYFLKRSYRTYSWETGFILSCMYVAFAYRAISQLAFFVPYPLNLFKAELPILTRLDFVSYVLILASEIVFVYLLRKIYKDRAVIFRLSLVILIVLNFRVFKAKFIDIKNNPIVSMTEQQFENSGWNRYYQLLGNNAFVIPLNPSLSENNLFAWGMGKNVEPLANIVIADTAKPESSLIPISYKPGKADYLCAVYMRYTLNEDIKILAFDDAVNIIDEVSIFNDKNNPRKYFYFKKNISPKYLRIVREDGSDIDIDSCNAVLIVGRT